MIKEEIVLGLIAAVFWALYVVLLKIASKHVPFALSNILLAIGILATAIITSLFFWQENISLNRYSLLIILAGALWFLGIFAVNYGIKKGLNISIMAPIYNLNTLLVVILSLVILKENVEAWRVILASILATAAAIILS